MTSSILLPEQQQQHLNFRRQPYKNFAHAKDQCLNKRDKSSAGRIDPHAVEICSLINELDPFYTTSSCSGRSFLYTGLGIKSTDTFQRFRVSHDRIQNAQRYFNLESLHSDPTGGGDADAIILPKEEQQVESPSPTNNGGMSSGSNGHDNSNKHADVWLRFEPFILHVACRSMAAASALMTAARPAFKNVGLTSWKKENSPERTSSKNVKDNNHVEKYIVAIWGDEGLDMPLCMPDGCPLQAKTDSCQEEAISSSSSSLLLVNWLANLVNERHERNWSKIARFVQAIRDMQLPIDDDMQNNNLDWGYSSRQEGASAFQDDSASTARALPRSFDVIGDVALLHSIPTLTDSNDNDGEDDEHGQQRLQEVGQAIMKKNKAIKVVVFRQSNLIGTERAPGHENLKLLAGEKQRLTPSLITTHCEYGISCVVDLHQTFFSPRMCRERQRICNQVKRDEDVLVLFAGVCMEALLLAGRTHAQSVVAMESNEAAIVCARRSQRMLQRNKTVLVPGAADRLEIIQGDVLELLPNIPRKFYDRILAPRPKLGASDGDLGGSSQQQQVSDDGADANKDTSFSSAATFLAALIPVLKDGGICHWYDFAADHEFPACTRIRTMLQETCAAVVKDNASDDDKDKVRCLEVLHVANAGSVAMRQLRVCIDFCIVVKDK